MPEGWRLYFEEKGKGGPRAALPGAAGGRTGMHTFFEYVVWALVYGVSLVGVFAVREARAERSALRARAVAAGSRTGIPCRIVWRQGLGHRYPSYGRLTPTGDPEAARGRAGIQAGAVFTRIGGVAVELPVGGRVERRPTFWVHARHVLRYRGPGGEEILLKVHREEAEVVARLLGARGPDGSG